MAEGFDGLDDALPTGAGASLLLGCGLPAAWAGQNQWRILETAWGDGQSFLRSRQAWTIASSADSPLCRSAYSAKSIIMMAFFLTIPISMMMPTKA